MIVEGISFLILVKYIIMVYVDLGNCKKRNNEFNIIGNVKV